MSEFSVYLADDERMIREGIKQLVPWHMLNLRFLGAGSDGKEAYRDITELKPDIVITDIKMPGMGGIELIRRTKEELGEIHFIVLSGYGEFELATQAMKHGVKHYLLKPCDETEIITVLKQVVHDLQEDKSKRLRIEETDKIRILNMRSIEEIHHYLQYEALEDSTQHGAAFGNAGRILIDRMMQTVQENLANEELSLLWLAQNHFFMNAEYLGKIFRKQTNLKFSQFVTSLRMEYAKRLITGYPDMKIYEVAEQVGFGKDQQYFGNVFRKTTGLTPLEYRKTKQS
ncbi:response regulator transcription factor [Paenibacillus luteus]|uniref:response regulator transcription factor n=1 Tax=Paenibacillus luteus TaxID=2545753 RepID=UPI0013759994|nr:response regulator [Paenibacillus luteus]